MSQHYTEVAGTLPVLFSRAADGHGGWDTLTDPQLRTVEPLRTWLMSRSTNTAATE